MRVAGGEQSPSAARSLSVSEVTDLKAVALALPRSWVAQLEPPYGQLAITPISRRPRSHRCWVASVAAGKIFRDDGRG